MHLLIGLLVLLLILGAIPRGPLATRGPYLGTGYWGGGGLGLILVVLLVLLLVR